MYIVKLVWFSNSIWLTDQLLRDSLKVYDWVCAVKQWMHMDEKNEGKSVSLVVWENAGHSWNIVDDQSVGFTDAKKYIYAFREISVPKK